MKSLIPFLTLLMLAPYTHPSETSSSPKKRELSLIRTLEKKEIQGIELVWASNAYHALATSFGHAFIRLVDTTPSWQDDLTLSAGLEKDVKTMKEALGAITGDYPLDIQFLRFGQRWHQYVVTEKRDFKRLVIVTNQDVRDRLKRRLINQLSGQHSPGNYTFLSNNCVSFLIELLKDSGIPLASRMIIVPSEAEQYLFESGVLSYAPSPLAFPERFKTLPERISDEFVSRIAESWEEEELKRFLLFFALKLSIPQIKFLKKKRGLQISPHEERFLQGYEEIPPLFYELCATQKCLQECLQEKKFQLRKNHPEFLARGYPFVALESDPSSPMGVGYVPIDMDDTEWSEFYRLNARVFY